MDWQRFLEENNISFVTRGPNTKRGEISIHCPMCGEDDPSEHLGINPQTGYWGCLRDSSHRGKSARTLIKEILACSSRQAQIIIRQYSSSDPDDLADVLSLLGEADAGIPEKAKKQNLLPEFKDFYQIKPRGISKRFFEYLIKRGYTNPQDIIERYDLRCALTGVYKDRIIIPIKMNGELLGWTSRALGTPISAPRYLASSGDVKTTVFNYDELKEGGERLFIVEGPFDAIKMDSFGQRARGHGTSDVNFRATCTFGTSVAVSQIILLRALVKKFDQTWILFDKGADQQAAELSNWVGALPARFPHNYKDPGEFPDHLLRLFASQDFDANFFHWT